jgi:hypothetical protein
LLDLQLVHFIGADVNGIVFLTSNSKCWASEVSQVVEYPSSNYEALSSKPSATKNKKIYSNSNYLLLVYKKAIDICMLNFYCATFL